MYKNKILKTLFIFLLSSTFLYSFDLKGKVIKIADGDTITILDSNNNQHKIRLNDIDAPEKKQAFGTKSKENLSKYIFGKDVIVKVSSTDRYNRNLGTIYLNNQDINLQQVKDGFAWVYKKYSKKQEYYKAEKEARENKKGLWIDGNPIEPSEFRRNKRVKN